MHSVTKTVLSGFTLAALASTSVAQLGQGGPPDECGWKLVELRNLPDSPAPTTAKCGIVTTHGSYGAGAAQAQAAGGGMSGSSSAFDQSNFCDINVSATAGSQWFERWKYFPCPGEPSGEVEVGYSLMIDGEIDLGDAPSASYIYGYVHFSSNVGGIDDSLVINFGRSTGGDTIGQVGVTGPYGASVSANITLDSAEGQYDAPAHPPKTGFAVECTTLFTLQHRALAYVESFADGWTAYPTFNYAECNNEISGGSTSDFLLNPFCPD